MLSIFMVVSILVCLCVRVYICSCISLYAFVFMCECVCSWLYSKVFFLHICMLLCLYLSVCIFAGMCTVCVRVKSFYIVVCACVCGRIVQLLLFTVITLKKFRGPSFAIYTHTYACIFLAYLLSENNIHFNPMKSTSIRENRTKGGIGCCLRIRPNSASPDFRNGFSISERLITVIYEFGIGFPQLKDQTDSGRVVRNAVETCARSTWKL